MAGAFYRVCIGTLIFACGCARQQETLFRAVPASPSLSADFEDANTWKQSSHIRDNFAQWDERYLYLRFRDSHGDSPEHRSLRLIFNNGLDRTQRHEIFIRHDGRCFDPWGRNDGYVELPQEEAFCRISGGKGTWIASVRISLASIRALGNSVYMTSQLRVVRAATASRPTEHFVEKMSGRIVFELPAHRPQNAKPVIWMPGSPLITDAKPPTTMPGS